MSEAEWLESFDLSRLLDYLHGTISERKLRFFAVACCRRIFPLLHDVRCITAVEVAERYADKLATEDEFQRVREESEDACGEAYFWAHQAGWNVETWVRNAAAIAAFGTCFNWDTWLYDCRMFDAPLWAARAVAGPEVEGVLSDSARPDRLEQEQRTQCDLLRDIVAFRLPTFHFSWRTPTVAAIADAAYHDCNLGIDTLDLDRLAVLADALEDAGCDNRDILEHLRSPGPHVRGCWVLDLILSKDC